MTLTNKHQNIEIVPTQLSDQKEGVSVTLVEPN